MPDPTTSPDLLRMLQDIDRRLRALEAAPQLQRASLTGGKITALNDGGQRVAEFGELVGGGYGIAVNDADTLGSILWVSDTDGVGVPIIEHAFKRTTDYVAVTSGSFTTVYMCLVTVPLARTLLVNVTCTCDALTTGELRLQLSTGPTSDVKALAAGAQTDAVYAWEHGADIGLGSTGFYVNVQARRTSGAGNVNVYCPLPAQESSAYAGTAGGL